MKLPNNGRVIISEEKLLDYILSETHAVGKFKAKFFRKLGFNETNVLQFKKQISILAKSNNISEEFTSVYGTKYVVIGTIKTPRGKSIEVKSVWIIEKNQNNPRFITIYPV